MNIKTESAAPTIEPAEDQDSQVAKRIAYAMAMKYGRAPFRLYGDCSPVVEDHKKPLRFLLDSRRPHADKNDVLAMAEEFLDASYGAATAELPTEMPQGSVVVPCSLCAACRATCTITSSRSYNVLMSWQPLAGLVVPSTASAASPKARGSIAGW